LSNSKLAEPSRYHIVFLRHGESVGNAEDRFQGQYDFPLTETGQAQVRALAERWRAEGVAFDLAVSSPLMRARQTAEAITDALDIPLEFDPLWMEWNNGVMAGLTTEEANDRDAWPPFVHPYLPIGQTGESRWELYLRAGQGLQKLINHPPGRYLVVAHGGVLNMVLYAILGVALQANFQGPSFRFHNSAFATCVYNPAIHRWYVWGLNDHAHWQFTDEE
jgi:broad specificity phosphatase PhoE